MRSAEQAVCHRMYFIFEKFSLDADVASFLLTGYKLNFKLENELIYILNSISMNNAMHLERMHKL